MITLEIRKKSSAVWWHVFSNNGTVTNIKTSGKFSFSLDGETTVLFSLIEVNQVSTDKVDIDNITIFDDTNSGLQYTFASRLEFELALQTIGYTGYQSGNVPIIENFIPLTGTEVGSPITGDIEVFAGFKIKTKNANEDDFNEIYIDDGGIILKNKPSTTIESAFLVGQQYAEYSNNDTSSAGIKGLTDFSENYDDLTYVQKIYVDNNFSKIISEVKTKTTTHTGTTTETFIRSIKIPANTLTANELLTVNSLAIKTGTGVCNSRIRLGQSITPSVSNPVVVFNISDNAWRCINKKLLIQDGNVRFSNIGTADDFEFTNQPFSLTFNNAVDNWLHMSVQLVTSSDTIYIANSKLSK
jgi:hypothetical protein